MVGRGVGRRVEEPHALTLSTTGLDGHPDARVLVLKDVTASGCFEVATSNGSAKGRQIDADPRVALTFYWPLLARSVRVRGVAGRATREESAADFRARAPMSKAIALVGRQSQPLVDLVAHDRLIAENVARLTSEPDLVALDWTVWRVGSVSVEFWQGDPSRDHLRLRYERAGPDEPWKRQRLRP